MNALDQDLVYEAQDIRPLIEMWALRFARVIGAALVAMSCICLVAAVKAGTQTIQVFAVTEKGDAFAVPFYATASEARSAAVAIDAAGVPRPANRGRIQR